MDLHLIPGATARAEERDAIDAACRAAVWPSNEQRDLLLPCLHAVHDRVGWISEGALNAICERLSVPPAEAYGVASFYALFSTKSRPPLVAHVCDDIACRAAGGETICRDLEQRLGDEGAPVLNGMATWLRSPCLGQCDRAPAALFLRAGENPSAWTATGTDAAAIEAALKGGRPTGQIEPTRVFADPPRLLRRTGVGQTPGLDRYRADGGYVALARALAITPNDVIRAVSEAKLVGRGGALFPTGRKWEAVARAEARPHYVVCNADESEPGTFKDRVLMEEDPFAVIESMTIAAYATGSERGYVYVRGEYPLATSRLLEAIAEARAAGLLGAGVMGSDLTFDIELRRGAGAYICGEETALFNSIEGFRGEPRNKPPFPVQSGLFRKPTAINNVETLVNVVDILRDGATVFAAIGTGSSTGTKLFCVSGAVARPGLYEAPFGITLGALIERAGGVRDNRPLQAVLLGGAAGMFVTAGELSLPLSIEGTSAAGAVIGSGVVMVFDDRVDLRDIVLRIAKFFRHESCGQCVPCRVGTVRQEEALLRGDVSLIDELGQVMRDASICGLGQTASSAVQSAIRKLRVFA